VVVAWVGFAGAIVSLLVLNILVGLQQVGRRAHVLAERLTSELDSSQAKLRQGELRMRYALEGSDDGIWDWDIRKGEMFVDGTIAHRMQWPSVFTVRTIGDLQNLAHPEDLVAIEKSISGLLKSEKVTHEVETRYRTPEGEWRWVLTRGKVSERNSLGKPVRMTGVHIDIHALKVAQSQLEGTKRLLGDIADNIPTLISIWDRELQCRYVNRAFADWFVVDPNVALAKYFKDFFQELQSDAFMSQVVELPPGQTYHLEINLRRTSDSSSRQVICLIKAREAQAVEGGFYLFIQDITEQKEAELEALRQRDLAEKAASVKSNFLANMSHEIRTPLNGIIGMTEMISGKIQDPEVSRNLGVLKKSSLSLLRLVNDILDLSKFEAGKTVLESHVFEVNELVEEVLGLFQVRIAEKGLRLVISSALEKPTYFSGDSLKLRQILTNLIANAVKFTEQGDISVTYSAVESGPDRVSLRFRIADTGIGMDELQLQRLFSPFSQADASTTRRFGGTGLGLAIAKSHVSLMGGRISVQSKLGSGSVFSFDVVMQVAHSLEENPESSSKLPILSRPQKDLRILVAEDNEINQQVVVGLITKLGFRCEVVVNGKEAVAAVQSGQFDLVLMDCHMPVMDGFESTQQIRALTGIVQPTIIAVSASSLAEDIERCRASGMNGFVGKPIDIQELKRVLADASAGVNERDRRSNI